jgi:hypothetical protein
LKLRYLAAHWQPQFLFLRIDFIPFTVFGNVIPLLADKSGAASLMGVAAPGGAQIARCNREIKKREIN